MIKEYTKEQVWKLYEKLPDELKEAIFSGETADDIWNICDRNEVNEVSKVAKYAGYVLMGVLPPDEFQETLEVEAGIKKEMAKKVTQEINRFIFYPVKPCLEEVYKIEIKAPAGVSLIKPSEVTPKEEERPSTPPAKDTYREPTE